MSLASVRSETGPAAGLMAALRGAAGRVTWQVAVATLGIALALELWSLLEATANPQPEASLSHRYLSALVTNVTMAFCLMFTTFVADELAAHHARRLPIYAAGIVVGVGVGAIVQWEIHRLLALPPRADFDTVPGDFAIVQRAFMFFDYLTWGSVIVWIYVNRCAELRAAARMSAAQLQRAEKQQRALKARLQAMQARVEPQFLQKALAQVRDRYEADPAEGSEMLGRLIVYLRAALPQLRDSASTLAREMDLARAYVDVMRGTGPDDIAFDADLPEALCSARMPAMVLLPLVNHVTAHRDPRHIGAVAIRISAHRSGTAFRLVVAGDGPCFDPHGTGRDLADIRERLRELYGLGGSLVFEPSARNGMRAIVTIPDETADGSHR